MHRSQKISSAQFKLQFPSLPLMYQLLEAIPQTPFCKDVFWPVYTATLVHPKIWKLPSESWASPRILREVFLREMRACSEAESRMGAVNSGWNLFNPITPHHHPPAVSVTLGGWSTDVFL